MATRAYAICVRKGGGARASGGATTSEPSRVNHRVRPDLGKSGASDGQAGLPGLLSLPGLLADDFDVFASIGSGQLFLEGLDAHVDRDERVAHFVRQLLGKPAHFGKNARGPLL